MINDQETQRHAGTSYTDAPTRTIAVGGVTFAYRELGPNTGVPVIFLTHLAAVLDNWDPRVIDGSAARNVHQLGSLATFAFVVCGALRLARFNLQATLPPEKTSKRYFVGLPIPAAAGMIASIVHFFKTPILMVGSALLWSFLILLLAFLMISTVRYYSFKEFDVKKARPSLALFGTAMLISLIYLYSEVMLLAMATVYVSSGLILNLTHTVRRFLPSSASRSEPAHGSVAAGRAQ